MLPRSDLRNLTCRRPTNADLNSDSIIRDAAVVDRGEKTFNKLCGGAQCHDRLVFAKVLISQLCSQRSATVVWNFPKEELLSRLNYHHLHSFNCIMSQRAKWRQNKKKKRSLTKPKAGNQSKISEEKACIIEYPDRRVVLWNYWWGFCSVDANVWLTWPWVNQNLRDAAVRDKSLSLPLNAELMIHTQAYLKYIQCSFITVNICRCYLNSNKSLNHALVWGSGEMPSVYSGNIIYFGLIWLKT